MEDPFRVGFAALATVLTTSQKVTHTSWRVFLSPGTSQNPSWVLNVFGGETAAEVSEFSKQCTGENL